MPSYQTTLLGLAALSSTALAASSTSAPTTATFVYPNYPGGIDSIQASVVGVDSKHHTTLYLNCPGSSSPDDSDALSSSGDIIGDSDCPFAGGLTIVENSDYLYIATVDTSADLSVTGECDIGTAAAICTVNQGGDALKSIACISQGVDIVADTSALASCVASMTTDFPATTTTISDFGTVTVTVTAGADKLAASTGKAASSATAAKATATAATSGTATGTAASASASATGGAAELRAGWGVGAAVVGGVVAMVMV
ncbi:hypothetical protein K490DRAFT_58290 [Saccharata proteae CBS 121410]|uniref:Uncharacterized protein n=1 Tax=Saccharata proteae CBS 121410 TaxID=1314787 RepID=A0A9P4HU57_9PEZI|nr:hypothetical protein K490DRAFT_58290 [Saccharata proteae CBS 121410]